jgi:hypothetical protein
MDAVEQQVKTWTEKNAAYLQFLGLDRANMCLTISVGIEQKTIFQIYVNQDGVPMVRFFLSRVTVFLCSFSLPDFWVHFRFTFQILRFIGVEERASSSFCAPNSYCCHLLFVFRECSQ